MNKLLFALIVSTFSAPVAAEWVKIIDVEDGSFFIDPETIRSNDHFRKAWLLINKTRLGKDGASSYRILREYDCENESSRILYLSGHSEQYAYGKALFSSNDPDKWEPTPPSTVDGKLLIDLCSLWPK